jgi:hypothetical protein
MVDTFMLQKAPSTFSSCWARGVACLIILLCICVVTQMLGIPATLIGLLNADVLTKSEPISEDFSTLSTLIFPERPGLFSVIADLYPVSQLPVLTTSVFRPPSA